MNPFSNNNYAGKKSINVNKHSLLQIIDNAGDGYSQSTGVFRATVTGLYQFSLSILSLTKGEYAHIQLMRNEVEIGRIFTGDVAVYGQMGTVTVNTQLTKGDEVYAREKLSRTGHVHGDSYCSFSGVLLSF